MKPATTKKKVPPPQSETPTTRFKRPPIPAPLVARVRAFAKLEFRELNPAACLLLTRGLEMLAQGHKLSLPQKPDRKAGSSSAKADKEETERLRMDLPIPLGDALKAKAEEYGCTQVALIIALLNMVLDARDPSKSLTNH